jgi:hypothetical protein
MDNIENQEIDLAQGTFVEKWPHWLRWLLFIPASIIVPILFVVFQFVMNTWFLDMGSNAFYFNLIRGAAYGGGMVVVGAMVAPRKQKIVALCFLVIISMLTGIAFLEQVKEFILNGFLEDLVTIIAAAAGTYYVFKEDKSF